MRAKLSKNAYTTANIGELVEDYESILEQYDKESVGPTRTKTLCDSLKVFNHEVFQRVSDTYSTEASRELGKQVKQKANFEEKEKEYKARLDNMKHRLDRFDGNEEEYGKEIDDLQKKNMLMGEELEETQARLGEMK